MGVNFYRVINYKTNLSEPAEPEECGQQVVFDGGNAYPASKTYNLGDDIGVVTLTSTPVRIPDRFIVKNNGIIKVDTGYYGDVDAYDIGKYNRSAFTSALTGKGDPVTGNTYPFSDPSHGSDGYPRVTSQSSNSQDNQGTDTFNKTSSDSNTFVLEVYAPMINTGWDAELSCPAVIVIGTTTTTTTTTKPPLTTTTTIPPGFEFI